MGFTLTPSGALGVLGTNVAVTNFPAVQAITGTVGVSFPASITTSGSNAGNKDAAGNTVVVGTAASGSTAQRFPVLVAGTDSSNVVRVPRIDSSGNTIISTTGSLPVTFSGQTQVTGTVNLDRGNNAVTPLFITGSLSTTAPAVTAVTGSQLTGSTFSDRPVVVGAVDGGGVIRAIRTDANGAISIFSTGSLPVTFAGSTQKVYDTGVQAVSGSQLTGSTAAGFPVIVGGTDAAGVVRGMRTGQNGEVSVMVTGSVPVLGAVSAYTQGAQLVSGTVGVNNFPAVQAVSGSQLTGSTAVGFPVIVGGVDASGFVRGIRTGINGEVSVFATGSLPVGGSQANGAANTQNPVIFAGVDSTGSIRIALMSGDRTLNVSGSVSGSNAGTEKVQGAKAITGLIQTGSTAVGYPVPIGTVDGGANTVVGVLSNMTTASLSATGSVNTIPLGVYTTAVSATLGQLIPFQSTQLGFTKFQEQFIPQAEDNVNNVIAVRPMPISSSLYSWTSTFALLVSASNVKLTQGVLRSISGRIDSSATTGNYFVHVYNSVTGVAKFVGTGNDAVAPLKIAHTSGIDNFFSLDFTECGLAFGAGIYIALSPYEALYDTTGSFMSFTALYS